MHNYTLIVIIFAIAGVFGFHEFDVSRSFPGVVDGFALQQAQHEVCHHVLRRLVREKLLTNGRQSDKTSYLLQLSMAKHPKYKLQKLLFKNIYSITK